MFNSFRSEQTSNVGFDCFVPMLVSPTYISCGPEQACFTGFLLVILKEHYSTYSTLCLLSSLAVLHCTQWQFLKKSDHLVITAIRFSWRQIWGFQLNWKQHWHSKEIETVSSAGFSEKIRTKRRKNVLILILAMSLLYYWHIFLSQRIYIGEI